jgi:hypothetical protein
MISSGRAAKKALKNVPSIFGNDPKRSVAAINAGSTKTIRSQAQHTHSRAQFVVSSPAARRKVLMRERMIQIWHGTI